MAVEPAFATRRIGAQGQIARVDPGITLGEFSRVEETNFDATAPLYFDVPPQSRRAGRLGERQIGRFLQVNIREPAATGAQELHAESRHLDVDRARELTTNRC